MCCVYICMWYVQNFYLRCYFVIVIVLKNMLEQRSRCLSVPAKLECIVLPIAINCHDLIYHIADVGPLT